MTHTPPPKSTDAPVSEIVETLEDATTETETCLRDILDDFGTASISALLLAVSLFLVSPLSGIPLFSSTIGLLIFAIAVQGAMGRSRIWMPRWLINVKVKSKATKSPFSSLRRAAGFLDRKTQPRLAYLVTPPTTRLIYGICATCGLVIPTMEIVPLASSLMGGAVSLISIGLLARDGAILVVGLCVIPLAAIIPITAYATLFF
ncbi:exopolysaccharide biosynthesis protein [Nereida sp. MMG025]|uniref:exopolysaccharide biosynthesis protein n=1 Tax=Nereida sp. MMG025 TaxID=2909981 RepID=UPI001F411B1C|nr:exopolysaccharide biosynthesis protein [Nereida sp. MMG025]MCF6445857.1 exopolysaccharide biosynthesis protein [Nereida sp. MMG025]